MFKPDCVTCGRWLTVSTSTWTWEKKAKRTPSAWGTLSGSTVKWDHSFSSFCFESSCASRSNRQKMACETRVLWKAFLKNSLRSLQEFEDLDEITARYIQPMASFARDLLGHKYFQECHGGSKEVHRIHSPVCFAISLILSIFARSCASHISVCLVFSLTENGGVIGEDEEGEAHFYSLFYFSL